MVVAVMQVGPVAVGVFDFLMDMDMGVAVGLIGRGLVGVGMVDVVVMVVVRMDETSVDMGVGMALVDQ